MRAPGAAMTDRHPRFFAMVSLGLLLVVAVPEVRNVLADLDHFRVREVQVVGTERLTHDVVLARAALRSGASVWDDLTVMEARLGAHPLIRRVEVRRRLPDGLVFELEERTPVAFLPAPVLMPVDAEARLLPIGAIGRSLDLPLIQDNLDSPGGSVGITARQLRLLTSDLFRLREVDPSRYAVLSEISVDSVGDFLLHLGEPRVTIRYRTPLAPTRLREGISALRDALERHPERPPGSVDLRFQGQVVVRYADVQASPGG